MHESLEQVSVVAKEYCSLIETVEEIDSQWLRRLAQILPQLHAAISALDDAEQEVDPPNLSDLDARFDIYAELHRLLGRRDGYWMEFDVACDGQCMTGSLADDLTDIYCELKHGLSTLEQEPQRACSDLRASFMVHWGQHLVDAERHLYSLRNKKEI